MAKMTKICQDCIRSLHGSAKTTSVTRNYIFYIGQKKLRILRKLENYNYYEKNKNVTENFEITIITKMTKICRAWSKMSRMGETKL